MNLPNKLTMFRIFLVPIIVLCYLYSFDSNVLSVSLQDGTQVFLPFQQLWVLVLFVVASITDFLDGYIARKYNLITSFGKFADPIADKLLVNTLFILLAMKHPDILVFVLIMIWRDTIVDAMRLMSAKNNKVVAAGMLGKVKTVLQMLTIVCMLLNNIPFVFVSFPMSMILLYASCIVSVVSGYQYFIQMKPDIMESV